MGGAPPLPPVIPYPYPLLGMRHIWRDGSLNKFFPKIFRLFQKHTLKKIFPKFSSKK